MILSKHFMMIAVRAIGLKSFLEVGIFIFGAGTISEVSHCTGIVWESMECWYSLQMGVFSCNLQAFSAFPLSLSGPADFLVFIFPRVLDTASSLIIILSAGSCLRVVIS